MSNPASKSGVVASEVLDAVFAALAHPTRRQILVSMYARSGVMTAGEIADRFKHSWPTITRHLGVLESAGLIVVSKKGRHRLYALKPEVPRQAADWINAWAYNAPDPTSRPEWADLSYATMRNAIPPKPHTPPREQG